MSFEDHALRELAALEEGGLLRAPREVAGAQGPTVAVDGAQVVVLCSNNYLGLAGDPRLGSALREGIVRLGAGAAASRHISGTTGAHREAEARLASFVGLPASLLFATGYSANVGSIPALARRGDVIFSDALNHASIVDGCRLSRAEVQVYRHLDLSHLEELLARHRARHRLALVATESLFSMDGDVAPLAAIRRICDRYDAGLLVDEAHALGVFGPAGAGLCAQERVTPDLLVGTLGKSFGLAGAFVAGSSAVVRLLENRARSFVFSTALPPALAAAAITAADIIAAADAPRARLALISTRLRQQLRASGFRVPEGSSPIIPLHIGDPNSTMRLSRALFERGVFVHGIRPPTVAPGTSRLRVTPMATHEDAHIDQAISAFMDIQKMYRDLTCDTL